MKVFRPDDGCFFNEALIWIERNKGNEVLDSGKVQEGYSCLATELFRG